MNRFLTLLPLCLFLFIPSQNLDTPLQKDFAALTAAMELCGKGDYDGGIERMKRLLEENPNFYEAAAALVNYYQFSGSLEEGYQYFTERMKAAPEEMVFAYGFSMIELRKKNFSSAYSILHNLMTKNVKELSVLRQFVYVAWEADSLQVAESLLKQFVSKYPNDAIYHFGLGGIWYFRRQIELAEEALKRAEELGENSYLLYSTQADINIDAGKTDSALKKIEQAHIIATIAGDPIGIIQILNMKAYVLKYIDPAKALPPAQEAYDLAKRYGHESLMSQALGNLMASSRRLGKLKEALAYQLEDCRLAKKSNDRSAEIYSTHDLGLIYDNLGNYSAAIENYTKALILSENPRYAYNRQIFISNLAVSLLMIERYEEALKLLRESLPDAIRLHGPSQKCAIFISMSLVFEGMGRADSAFYYIEQALKIAREINYEEAIQIALNQLGRISDADDKAILYYQEALALAEKRGRLLDIATYKGNLAIRYLNKARYQKTKQYIQEAMKTALEQKAIQLFAVVIGAEAKLYDRLQQRDKAVRTVEHGIEICENGQLQAEEDYTVAHLWAIDQLYGLAIRMNGEAGNVEKAWYYIEKRKSRGMAYLMRRAKLLLDNPLPDSVAMSLQTIEDSLQTLRQEKAANEVAGFDARIDYLQAKRQRIFREIAQTDPRYASLLDQPAPGLKSIQEKIGASEMLLSYHAAKDTFYLCAVEQNEARFFSIPISKDSLKAKLAALSKIFSARATDEEPIISPTIYFNKEKALELYELLVERAIANKPHITQLIISPDDVLNLLPFDVLRMPASDVSDSTATQYLIERYAITYIPTATILADERPAQAERPATALLALGNPITSELDSASSQRIAVKAEDIFALPASGKEVSAIADLFRFDQQKTLLAENASKQRFLAEVSQNPYRIIHIASHNLPDNTQPLYSRLILSRENGEPFSSLFAYEFLNMKLPSDLVVLSSCSSARGKLSPGDGLMGIWRALYIAGARSVVASLWNVDDEATARLMTDFYQALFAGKSRAEALQQAKINAIRQGGIQPAQWAPFILIGDGSRLEPPLPKAIFTPMVTGILIVVLLSLIVIAIFMIRRRQKQSLMWRISNPKPY